MPAESEPQRRLMGAALAAKRAGRKPGGQLGKVVRSMSESQLRDYARKPKRKGRRSRRK